MVEGDLDRLIERRDAERRKTEGERLEAELGAESVERYNAHQEGERAGHAQEERAKQVMRVLHAGAAELAWSTHYAMDYGLQWDHKRQVWAATDGFAYAPPDEVMGGGGHR